MSTISSTGQRWASWLGYQQLGNGTQSVWEGGRYHDFGIFRPTDDSIMRFALTNGYNSPSIEKMIHDIYTVVSPLDAWSDETQLLPQEFSVSVTPLDPRVILTEWYVDGVDTSSNGLTFTQESYDLTPGLHTITAVAYDEIVIHAFSPNSHPLDLVRHDLERLEQSVTWTVVVGPDSLISLDRDSWRVGEVITLNLIDNDAAGSGQVSATVISAQGDQETVTLIEQLPGQFQGELPSLLGEVSAGNGVLDLSDRQTLITASYIDLDLEGGVTNDTAMIDSVLSGVVHTFHFDEGVGEVTRDEVGGLEGSLIEPATWTHRVMNESAIELSSPADYIDLGVDLGSTLNGEATVVMYLKTTQSGAEFGWSSPSVMGAKYYGDCCLDIYWGWIDGEGHINISAGAWGVPAKSAQPINDDLWHRVVMTRSLSGQVEIYVDGALDSRVNGEPGFKSLSVTSIGRREDKEASGQTVGYQGFDGSLDELMIFDRRLTPAEVDYLSLLDRESPVALDDDLSLRWDGRGETVDVRLNDTSATETSLSILGFTQPTHGITSHLGDGVFEYLPNGEYVGQDTFTYTVSDGFKTARASVHVEVLATSCDYSCDDDNSCTTDECDGFGGCTHNGSQSVDLCDDGDLCTEGERCQGDELGTCGGGEWICEEPGGEMTGGEMTGGEMTGGEMTGGEMTGGEMTGGEMTGGEMTGGEMTGGEMTGGEMTGGEMTGGEITGGEMTGGEMTGGEMTGGEMTGGEITGGEMTGGEMTGGEITGGEITGGEITGGEITGGEITGGEMAGEEMTGGEMTESSGSLSSGGCSASLYSSTHPLQPLLSCWILLGALCRARRSLI